MKTEKNIPSVELDEIEKNILSIVKTFPEEEKNKLLAYAKELKERS